MSSKKMQAKKESKAEPPSRLDREVSMLNVDEIKRMDPTSREQLLLDMVTRSCSQNEPISLENSWKLVEMFGISILFAVLSGEIREGRPFGAKGISGLYTIVFRISSGSEQSDGLRDKYENSLSKFFRDILLPSIADLRDEFLLRKLHEMWGKFRIMAKWLHKIFCFLDSELAFVTSLTTLSDSKGPPKKVITRDTRTITSSALFEFYKSVYQIISPKLKSAMLDLVVRQRNGEEIDRDLFRSGLEMFILMGMASTDRQVKSFDEALASPSKLDIYIADFETAYLEHARQYYAAKSQEWLKSNDIPTYLSTAESATAEEEVLVKKFMAVQTMPKISQVCMMELIIHHKAQLVDSVKDILREIYTSAEVSTFSIPMEKQDELRTMYNLFERTRLLDTARADYNLTKDLSDGFGNFVFEMGKILIEQRRSAIEIQVREGKKEDASEPEFVDGLISLHNRSSEMIRAVFNNDNVFLGAQKTRFTDIMNDNASNDITNASMLAYYADRILKGVVRATEDQLELSLSSVLAVFNYVVDKDMFAETYRDLLSSRLMGRKSISDDQEKNAVQKMKLLCGSSFTNKLEGMLNDFAIADDVQKEFKPIFDSYKDSSQGCDVGAVDFSVLILTTNFWKYKYHNVMLPRQLTACVELFTDWYVTKNNYRQLTWVHTQGEIVISGKYGRKAFDIILTTIQGVVLFLFSDSVQELSVDDVVQRSGIADKSIAKPLLHSLSTNPRFKLLSKTGNPKSIGNDDKFRSNGAFASNLKKFRVPAPTLDGPRSGAIDPAVMQEREIRVDAAIVRIAKARKTVSHGDLVVETLHQLQFFQPDRALIKRRVAHLIESEYLKRNDQDPNIYEYLA